ncbi:MAG: DNA polymerase I [Candidatus Falkowbacteria bacterium]
MIKNNKKLIIIDGNALIHRSFHALPPTMVTKKGEMTNAVYGFTTVLLKAIREFKPDYVALTLDKKAPTFRHEKYKEYKAKRVKAPDELYKQIPRVKEIAKVFNIPIYEMSGYEADDLIGTISKTVDGKIEKIIVTGDMDTLQLVNEHTKVYTMSRGLSDSVIYNIKQVQERYRGLKPDQMIDYKALRGDPSDNIPGVRGIGEKTATELLRNFKTLDGVYKNLDSKKVKPRISELLKKYKEDAFMSKDLATIKCDVKIDFKLEDAKFGDYKKEEIVKLFSELDFKSLISRIKEVEKEDKEIDKFARNKKMFKYYLVDDDKKFEDFLKKLKKQKEFAFDTETSCFNPVCPELLGISFSWENGVAYYLEIANKKSEVKNDLFNYKNKEDKNNLLKLDWLKKMKPIFEDEKIKKFGHNIKYDIKVVGCYDIDTQGVEFDTMIASYLLNPGTRQHNLDSLTFSETGHEKISKKDLLGAGKDKITFSEVGIEKLYNYSCEDADFTNRLVLKLRPQLKKQKLDKLFHEIEMPLVKVLGSMETNGMRIDTNFLAKISSKTRKKIHELEKKIYKQAGMKFNINSTQQLRDVLFEKLEIPSMNIKRNKTGFSTGADELVKLKDLHPIIKLIQEYRELAKLISTYIDALPKLVNEKTGRVHTSFNQSVTATGRLSSTEPNLQNIPVRTELGREIRKAFVADKGYKLVSLDYSQIELRIAAHMSGDKKMIKAFNNNVDIHRMTASEINQVSPDEVTSEMRRQAKAVNFGILYGQGPRGLSQGADIPYSRAKEFIDQYFLVYNDVKKFIDKTIEHAREKEYVETMFNRRRYLPEINSSVMQVKKSAERMAINTPLQGTAADMIKVAMAEIFKTLSPETKMLLQVHDELLFEIKNDEVEKWTKKIKDIMENVIKLKVPVVVDVKVGENWGEMKRV